ncbi:hypothetical protein GF352_04110 [archaeon]|nr:hypothetical protein [archaeon]
MNKEQLNSFINGESLNDYVKCLDNESRGYYKSGHYGFLEEYLTNEFTRLSEDELFKAGMGFIIGTSIAGAGTLNFFIGNQYASIFSLIGLGIMFYSYYKFKKSRFYNNKDVFEHNLKTLAHSLKT